MGSLILATSVSAAFAATAEQMPVPQGAKLVGEATVTEIRAFPEEVQGKGGTHAVEEAQKVAGTDRLYETKDNYASAVSYFDRTLSNDHFTVDGRTVTKTSTIWALKRPDGSIARLAVRNTTPTTVEWVAARQETDTGKQEQQPSQQPSQQGSSHQQQPQQDQQQHPQQQH